MSNILSSYRDDLQNILSREVCIICMYPSGYCRNVTHQSKFYILSECLGFLGLVSLDDHRQLTTLMFLDLFSRPQSIVDSFYPKSSRIHLLLRTQNYFSKLFPWWMFLQMNWKMILLYSRNHTSKSDIDYPPSDEYKISNKNPNKNKAVYTWILKKVFIPIPLFQYWG